MKQAETECIRCGKRRVFFRKWQDRTDGRGPIISHVETVCPDRDCQKKVDEMFAKMRERRMVSEEKRKSITLGKRNAKTISSQQLSN